MPRKMFGQRSLLRGFPEFAAWGMLRVCPVCKRPRIENVLDKLATGKNNGECMHCKANANVLEKFVKFFFARQGVSPENVRKMAADPLYRRTIIAVLKGIKQFGINKPQPTGIPAVVVWNFTGKCNLDCKHCYGDTGQNTRDLTTTQSFQVVDKLADAGIVAIGFSGGEPLMRKDLLAIAKHAARKGIYCTLASNGTLITKEMSSHITEAGIRRVEIGLDGSTAKTHDAFRGVKGAFDKAVRGIRNCTRNKDFDEVIVNTTLTQKTFRELPRIMELAEKLGATRFYLSRILPAGRGKNIQHKDVSPRQMRDALEMLARKLQKSVKDGGMQCYARGMTYYARTCYELTGGDIIPVGEILSGYERRHTENFGTDVAKMVNKLSGRFGGCSAGINYCGLSSDGFVLPCACATDVKLGSLLVQDLKDIWVNHRVFKTLRDKRKLKGRCRKCAQKDICGGCRLNAFGLTGNWMASDPTCPYLFLA